MSSSSHHQAALERLVAQLDLLHSRLRLSDISQPPSPSPSLFPFSMPLQSEIEDVKALDKCLDEICEKTFGTRSSSKSTSRQPDHRRQPHRRPSHSARSKHTSSRSKHNSSRSKHTSSRSPSPEPSRTHKPPRPKSSAKSAKSSSSTASSAPPARPPTRTPKRPRTGIALRSVPAPKPPTHLRSVRIDAPTSSTSAKQPTPSTPHPRPKHASASHHSQSEAVTLQLRIKPSRDHRRSDQQPSQSSHRTKSSSKRARHQPQRERKPASDDERRPTPSSRRASTTSTRKHHRTRDSRHRTPSPESRTPEPQTPARRENTNRSEKHRSRQRQKRTPKNSAAQSRDVPLDTPQRTRSHQSNESVPGFSARRRRKAHTIATHSDDESLHSDDFQRAPRHRREFSRKRQSAAHRREYSRKREAPAHRRADKSPTHSESSPEPPARPQPPPKPLQFLLSFAHKPTSLSPTDGLDEAAVLKRRKSLATIPGCERFEHFSVFLYCRALCHHHMNALQSMHMSYEDRVLSGKLFDALSYDIDDDKWQHWITDGESNGKPCPPGLSKSLDAVQFMLRLLEEIVDSEEKVAGRVMEEWYERGLTTELANWMLTALKFWSVAKHHEGEHDDNYSELVDWIIRLTCSIITYELSPSSLVYSVKNLEADKLFISSLRGTPGEESVFPFQRTLNSMLQFVSGFPGSVGKECRVSLSQLVQAYLLRSGVPWGKNSPQRDAWKAIHESSLDLPKTLCQSDFFWSYPFTKSLQQVRREPLAADSCFDVGFLVNVVSSPLFMRELLQNQSKCLELLCEVLTNTLMVLGREPLISFRTIIEEEKHYPSVPSVLDLLLTLLSSAVMQRELLTTDTKIKKLFLDSVDVLLTRSARMGSNAHFQDTLDRLASKAFLGQGNRDSILEKPRASGAISEEKIMIKQRVLSFNSQVLASMGKSLEDGSRDMSQMNTLKAYLATKVNSTRNRRRVWEIVLRIQGGLDRFYTDSGKKVEVLSPKDRNHFSMVVEAIRKHFQLESVDSQKTPSSTEDKSISSNEVPILRKRSGNVSFPPVTHMPHLCKIASRKQGNVDLDEDPQILRLAHEVITDKAQQALARYDPNSDYAWKWVRLQRKNAYIGGARDLLEKNDRTLGQRCSCLPGNAKEKKDGSEIRVACSNDLCENRHLRIECVPGECGAGSYCQNQRLQRLEYAEFKMTTFPNKGVGLVADEDIKAGSLIGEYQGEVISRETFKQRMREYQGERHFYFMTLTNKLIIDASRKSQATRFLNHSCDPNSETQKWNAGGEPRVGIYAIRDIVKGEELTFDYGARSIEKGSAPCVCGSLKCRGTLTSKQEEAVAKSSTSNPVVNECNNQEHSSESNPDMKGTTESIPTDQDVMKRVQEKIARAKNDLKKAEELDAHAKSLTDDQKPWDEKKLTPNSSNRLKVWREATKVTLKGHLEGSRPQLTDRADSSFRIPRRSIPLKSEERNEALKMADVSGKRPERLSDAKEISGTQGSNAESVPLSIPRIPRRSSFADDLRPQNASSRQAASSVGLKASEKKPVSEQPLSRAALVGIEKGFQPSSTKYKRKPLKPKIKERVRTRKTGSGSDSMDEYSTASEAEPIMDEKPVSPSQLPDGKGARSDDEFVAVSPLEHVNIHRQEERQNVSMAQKPGLFRRERHEQGIQQRSFGPEEARKHEQSAFISARHPDGESRGMDHKRLPHAQVNIDSNTLMYGHQAPRSREAPPIPVREAHTDRYGSRFRAVERLHRDHEHQTRSFRHSHEPFRGNSPSTRRDPGGPHGDGHNRFGRARTLEGGYDISVHRDERQAYHSGYGQSSLPDSSRGRIRERRDAREGRWSGAGPAMPRGRGAMIRHPHRDGWNSRGAPQGPAQQEVKPHSTLRAIPYASRDGQRRKEPSGRTAEQDRVGEKRERHENINISEAHPPTGPRKRAEGRATEGELSREQSARRASEVQNQELRPKLRSTKIDKGTKPMAKVTSKAEKGAALEPQTQSRLGGVPVAVPLNDHQSTSKLATSENPAPTANPKPSGTVPQKIKEPMHEAEVVPKPNVLPPLRSSTALPVVSEEVQGSSNAPRQEKSASQARLTGAPTEPHAKLPSSGISGHRIKEKEAKTRPSPKARFGSSFEVKENEESMKQVTKADAAMYAHPRDDRAGDNLKRTEREEDPDKVRGPHSFKRRRSESDGQRFRKSGDGSGINTNGVAPAPEIGVKGSTRTGDSRADEEPRGRDRWKHYDDRDGGDDDGFRRRNVDTYRDDRKRSRHWSPGRTQKRRRKSNREVTRSGLQGDKSREQEVRRHPSNVPVVRGPVVRGSTHQKDLRSIIKKSRTGE